MRLLTGILSVALCLVGVARADNSSALMARLNHAAADTSLYAPTLKPWHLKVNFQIFDEKGANPVDGVLEEWWAGPRTDRITYTFPGFNATTLQTERGTFYSPGMVSEPFSLEALHDAIVHPVSSDFKVDGATPDTKKVAFGNVKLDCIALPPPRANVSNPPLGLFPTFCFTPASDALRFTFRYGTQSLTRNGMGRFQGQSVSTDLKLSIGKLSLAEGKVVTLQTMPAAEMNLNPAGLDATEKAQTIAGSVIAGSLVRKVAPRYPESAKQAHISGDVVLHAVIGKNGHIRQLEVESTPDADLAIASIFAVREWVYKPYLVNGKPVEVETTITVKFNFG